MCKQQRLRRSVPGTLCGREVRAPSKTGPLDSNSPHFQKARERIGHPRLRPTHIRNAHGMKAATLMIEESAAVAQVFDRPLRYLFSQNHRAWNVPVQLDQGYYR